MLAAQERELGADLPDTLLTAGNLAMSISYQGKYAEGEKMQREVLAAQERKLGAKHPSDSLLQSGTCGGHCKLTGPKWRTASCCLESGGAGG